MGGGGGEHRNEPPGFGTHLSTGREPCFRRMLEPGSSFSRSSGSRKDTGTRRCLTVYQPTAQCYTR